MTSRKLLNIALSGLALGAVWSARAEAQDPPITKVAVGPVSTALPGSYVINRFWNQSGAVTVVSATATPGRDAPGHRISAVVSGGMVLSDGRGGTFQVPDGAQINGRYIRRNDWKVVNSCVVYDSIQVGGKTLPISGFGGCLPMGSWNLTGGSSLAWVAPEAGPEAFPTPAQPAGDTAKPTVS